MEALEAELERERGLHRRELRRKAKEQQEVRAGEGRADRPPPGHVVHGASGAGWRAVARQVGRGLAGWDKRVVGRRMRARYRWQHAGRGLLIPRFHCPWAPAVTAVQMGDELGRAKELIRELKMRIRQLTEELERARDNADWGRDRERARMASAERIR